MFSYFCQDVILCDIYGNLCFEKYTKNAPSGMTCDCPMGCNELSYSFSFVSTRLDPDEVCTENGYGSLMWSFYQNKYPPQHVRTLLKIKSNISDDAAEYCRKNLDYRAEVIFRMATDSMPVTVMSSRLSFFDKMSSFGK